MKMHAKIKLLALSVGIAFGGAAAAATEVVYLCATADGGSELSNVDTGNKCEQLLEGTPAAAAPTAPAAGTAKQPAAQPQQAANPADPAPLAAASTDVAATDAPVETPASRYRDAMLKGAANTAGTSGAALNPAKTRRYLMTNRTAYQQQTGTTPAE
jgi:hypothetical protein